MLTHFHRMSKVMEFWGAGGKEWAADFNNLALLRYKMYNKK